MKEKINMDIAKIAQAKLQTDNPTVSVGGMYTRWAASVSESAFMALLEELSDAEKNLQGASSITELWRPSKNLNPPKTGQGK